MASYHGPQYLRARLKMHLMRSGKHFHLKEEVDNWQQWVDEFVRLVPVRIRIETVETRESKREWYEMNSAPGPSKKRKQSGGSSGGDASGSGGGDAGGAGSGTLMVVQNGVALKSGGIMSAAKTPSQVPMPIGATISFPKDHDKEVLVCFICRCHMVVLRVCWMPRGRTPLCSS